MLEQLSQTRKDRKDIKIHEHIICGFIMWYKKHVMNEFGMSWIIKGHTILISIYYDMKTNAS